MGWQTQICHSIRRMLLRQLRCLCQCGDWQPNKANFTWGGKLGFATASAGCFSDSFAVSANAEIGSPIRRILHGVANSDLPQHPQDASQTASLSLPMRRLAAQ
ncbi:MAG: hypothetical protein M0P99_01675 [Candidatus Cloacimonetes bacterium]|nr:hypothetical protein [Candidatus Cloacimonadota bacterium]